MREYLGALHLQIKIFEHKYGFRPGCIAVSFEDYRNLHREFFPLLIDKVSEEPGKVFGIKILRSPDLKEGEFKLCLPVLY